MPHESPTRSDSPAGSHAGSPSGSPRVRAAERGELDRATVVPPGVLDLITRDLAAGLAAEVVSLALRDRQGVVLLSSADEGRHVDSTTLAEGGGFIGRALRLGRAAVEPVDPQAGALCAGFSGRPAL